MSTGKLSTKASGSKKYIYIYKLKEGEINDGKRSPVVPMGDIFAVGLQSRSFSALADSITQISKGTKEIP